MLTADQVIGIASSQLNVREIQTTLNVWSTMFLSSSLISVLSFCDITSSFHLQSRGHRQLTDVNEFENREAPCLAIGACGEVEFHTTSSTPWTTTVYVFVTTTPSATLTYLTIDDNIPTFYSSLFGIDVRLSSRSSPTSSSSLIPTSSFTTSVSTTSSVALIPTTSQMTFVSTATPKEIKVCSEASDGQIQCSI